MTTELMTTDSQASPTRQLPPLPVSPDPTGGSTTTTTSDPRYPSPPSISRRSSSFLSSSSPDKQYGFSGSNPRKFDPNPHPYAIKTTSTALLSRANSSGHANSNRRHHYVPLSPSQSGQTRSRIASKEHRHTKSFSSAEEVPRPLPTPPRPLPTPPSSAVEARPGEVLGENGWIFAEPVEVMLPASDLEDLPSNPKLWTPPQLATYLTTALRVRSGGRVALPQAVARDVAAFIKQSRISGRAFLRLNEDDLEAMDVNKLWRVALLDASRNLRQNVVKGRIWGFDADSDSPPSTFNRPPPPVFSNNAFNSSSSSLELSDASESELTSAQLARRDRNGRVRGMIATLERRGSQSSASDADSEPESAESGLEIDIEPKVVVAEPDLMEGMRLPEEEAEPSIEELLAQEQDKPSMGHSWGARAWEQLDLAPGATARHLPSPPSTSASLSDVSPPQSLANRELVQNGTDSMIRVGKGSGKSNGSGSGKSSGSGRERNERRIVTAIFAPEAPSQPEPAEETVVVPESEPEPAAVATSAQLDSEAMAKLEADLVAARGLVDMFRERLDGLEKRQEGSDAREKERATADALREEALRERELELERRERAAQEKDRLMQERERLAQEAEAQRLVLEEAKRAEDEAKRIAAEQQDAETKRRAADASNALIARDREARLKKGRDLARRMHDELPSFTSLPSYMLMIGLGVCVITLRVVLRKVAGRPVR